MPHAVLYEVWAGDECAGRMVRKGNAWANAECIISVGRVLADETLGPRTDAWALYEMLAFYENKTRVPDSAL